LILGVGLLLLWSSFIVSIALMLWIAQKNLWLGLFVGAFLLGIFNLPLAGLARVGLTVMTDASILLLGLAVGIIPLIGAVLSKSGLMDELLGALRMRSRHFLMIAPAFLGMLPMPGGALLSAPIVAKVGDGVTNRDYAAINVWFRHVLVMIYPLGGLLATSKMAQMNVYTEMVILIPAFLIMTALGYLFLLRPVDRDMMLSGKYDGRKIAVPLIIIISAPVIHLTLMSLFPRFIPEIPLVIGVTVSLLAGLFLGNICPSEFAWLFLATKPWRYFLIIIGMFAFLRVFEKSAVTSAIAALHFSPTVLVVGVGFLLGALTGRAQLAFSLLLPIYYAKFGASSLTPVVFAIMYFSNFMGYLMSPIHPCILMTLEYFQTDLRSFYRHVAAPFVITFLLLWMASWLIQG